eukprot:TRINITY_DN7067_c0_g1_i1.p1 TRINITY_DN7067_c0_g1~~TRINITY_DN7067_c0_g1_i1.p1  ORF type:complete len:186 (+),score=38.94 TRINITY_DN7067_c0_g1_i1:46-603(+)
MQQPHNEFNLLGMSNSIVFPPSNVFPNDWESKNLHDPLLQAPLQEEEKKPSRTALKTNNQKIKRKRTRKTTTSSTKPVQSSRTKTTKKKDDPKLEKNRYAAQQFRQRQRELMSTLETQIKELKKQQTLYKSQTEELQRENDRVRAEVTFMRDFLAEALSFAFPYPTPCQPPMEIKPDPCVQSKAG